MYTEKDLGVAKALVKKRRLQAWLPGGVLLLAGIALFVYGQIARSDTLWLGTVALTLLGGGWILFWQGAAIRPAVKYRKHIEYMLNGRMLETTGILTAVEDNPKDHEGLECCDLMLNIGEKNDPEDDRLFYWDVNRPLPREWLGQRVTLRSNSRFVSSLVPEKG